MRSTWKHAQGNHVMTKIIDKTAQGSNETSGLTRRGFFDRVMLAAAGGAALMLVGTSAALAKVKKVTAKYRSSPKSGKSCGGCKHYKGSGRCALVAGTVSSSGYCRYYSKKSGYSY